VKSRKIRRTRFKGDRDATTPPWRENSSSVQGVHAEPSDLVASRIGCFAYTSDFWLDQKALTLRGKESVTTRVRAV
jgi:hypothetical protein